MGGATRRQSWGAGLTTAIALADLLPMLDDEDRYLVGQIMPNEFARVVDARYAALPEAEKEALAERLRMWWKAHSDVDRNVGASESKTESDLWSPQTAPHSTKEQTDG